MAAVRVQGVRRSRHRRTLLALAAATAAAVMVVTLVPWRCNSEPGPRDVLNREATSPASEAATLRRGRSAFYADDLDSEVFFTDAVGVLDGPLPLRSLMWSLLALRGRGTTDLRVTLADDATIGGHTFKRGEQIDTGLDVAEGSLVPLGVVVHMDHLRVRVGFTCALCHSAVDPETRKVIHGAANGDLQIGLLLALASGSAKLAAHAGVADADADEDAVDRVFLAWPAGSFDATPDGVANPTRIPDVFTRDEAPYGWTGSGRTGPFRGLASFIQDADGGHPFVSSDPSRSRPIPWETALAIACWLNTLSPPVVAVDDDAAVRGRDVFARANCGRCHSSPSLAGEQPAALDQVDTDPSRAGKSGEYAVPGLVGLWWSAPYLHDGGVAVAPGERKVGVADSRAVAIDPRSSLRALLDRELRTRVVAANRADRIRWDLHVRGIGHEFWVDPAAGFSVPEQQALIEYLLSLRHQQP